MNASFSLSSDALKVIAAEVASLLATERSDEPEPWIDTDGAAEHLACTRRRIYELANAKRIPFVRDGKRYLFRRSALDASLGVMA